MLKFSVEPGMKQEALLYAGEECIAGINERILKSSVLHLCIDHARWEGRFTFKSSVLHRKGNKEGLLELNINKCICSYSYVTSKE